MPPWVPWACVVWSLAGSFFMLAVGRYWGKVAQTANDQPAFELPPGYFKLYEGTWEDQMRQQLARQRDRNFDLCMRVYELETENKRLAQNNRSLYCLLLVRECRGQLDTLDLAAENGMGC